MSPSAQRQRSVAMDDIDRKDPDDLGLSGSDIAAAGFRNHDVSVLLL